MSLSPVRWTPSTVVQAVHAGVSAKPEMEATMSLKRLLEKEIYVRLIDDETAFRCTVRYGKLYSKKTEFLVDRPVECPAVLRDEEHKPERRK